MLEIRTTQDGSRTIYNSELNTTYHSSWGAIQESRIVFIGNGLKAFDVYPEPLHILEIGFGTGLNAWLSWRETKADSSLHIHYTGIEPFPLNRELWSELNYADTDVMSEFKKLHELIPGQRNKLDERFSVCVRNEYFQEMEFDEKYHLIYFDAFDPATQPEMWSDEVIRKCASLLIPGGIWVSYCSKGDVRRSLQDAQLEVKRLKGPPGKRQILQARKPSLPHNHDKASL